jgi:hypothetical protein
MADLVSFQLNRICRMPAAVEEILIKETDAFQSRILRNYDE